MCGPTVYNLIHIGNARPMVVFDVMARHFRMRGYKITYVSNITDIDDKIIAKSIEEKETPSGLAKRFYSEFQQDQKELGCLLPDFSPKATDHIPEMISHIQGLIQKDMAYESEGDVYFSVQSFSNYGQLTRLSLDELLQGVRKETVDRKRDPADFALWKAAKPGEPAWESPWGLGRPGWHIECSAMAEKYLGITFDIHGGGIDLRFPHHENEIAQSQGLHGFSSFAKYWMHNGHIGFRWVHQGQVLTEGTKIAKSDVRLQKLLPFFLARFCIKRHGGEAVRLYLLGTHYRSPMTFDVEAAPDFDADAPVAKLPALEEAEQRLEYGYLTLQKLQGMESIHQSGSSNILPEAETWLQDVQEALDDDLNTPEALAAWQKGLSLANRLLDTKTNLGIPKEVRQHTLVRIRGNLQKAGLILGLLQQDPNEWLSNLRARRLQQRGLQATEIEKKISQRLEARLQKDFVQSDLIRNELSGLGIELMDTTQGTTWRVQPV